MSTPFSPRTILFANGKKRAQLTSHAQDNADGSVTLSFASQHPRPRATQAERSAMSRDYQQASRWESLKEQSSVRHQPQ
jgi:hypothetical protein